MHQPSLQASERPTFQERVELVRRARGERAGAESSAPAARYRPERGRGLRDDEVVAAALEVDAVLLPAAAGVRRRLELADQPQLLERRLELGAQHAPLEPLEREQGRLDGRPLPVTPEVGAEARTEVPRAADVEHLVVAVTKEIDAGSSWGALGQRALAVDAALAGRGERAEVGEPPRPELLRQADQVHQHLGRRLGIG